MSLVELFFRFAVVAAVFAGAMVLLRRYGRSRLRQAEATHGLIVTSRLTLSRGVQLLTVKAGRRSFLVSSGGRVTVVPLEDASVPVADDADPESQVVEASLASGGVVDAEGAASRDTAPSGSGNWAMRLGQSVGLAARRRWRKSSGTASDTADVPDFALYLDAAEQAAQQDFEDVSHEPREPQVSESSPRQRVAVTDTAAFHDARIDVDVAAVLLPALPTAPGASSAVSRAQASLDSEETRQASSRGSKPRTKRPSSPKTEPNRAPAPGSKPRTSARAKATPPADASSSESSPKRKKPAAPTPRRSRASKSAPSPTAPKSSKASSARPRKSVVANTDVPQPPSGKEGVPSVEIWVSELPASTPSSPVTPAASLLPAVPPARPELPVVPLQGALQA